MTYFTSDLHLGHANVLRFDNRPFSSVEENDEELIKRWNAKVKQGDTVYCLGDLIWKTYGSQSAEDILKSLNGQKILIRGNHDHWINRRTRKQLAAIKDYDDIKVTLEDGTVKRCILSHYPIHFYNGQYHGAIMLYGHVHTTKDNKLVADYAKFLNEQGCPVQMFNVFCGLYNYEPVTLDEILKGAQND